MRTALIFGLLLGQTPAPVRDMKWLSEYTAAHGRLYEENVVVQVTRLHPIGECKLRLEREYPHAKTPKRITKETASLALGDFDPNVHVQISRTGNPSFLVIIEIGWKSSARN